METNDAILFYEAEYYCFSNFSSFAVYIWNRLWMTSEHAYQAAKFDNEEIRTEIRSARSAHDAKQIAKRHKADCRPDWDAMKVSVMEDILRAKLDQHEFIQNMLDKSGSRTIIENSPRDSFWGWGPGKVGQNNLGKLWMKLRDERSSQQ